MKIVINEGSTSGLCHLGSLPSPFKDPISPWGRAAPLGGDGNGTSPTSPTRVPKQRTGMGLTPELLPHFPPAQSRPQNFTQKMQPDSRALDRALCLQTGHTSTFTPSFVFAKLLRPIKLSLRLFLLTLQLYLVAAYLSFLRWQTFGGGKQLGQKANHLPSMFWEKT